MQNTVDSYQIVTIALLWLAFFLIHSVTASLNLKSWVARYHTKWMPAYRLAFNAFSVILVLPILWLSFAWSSEPLWHWGSVMFWLLQFITLLTIIAFYFSLRYYDMAEFMGTKQWSERNQSIEDQEQFKIGEFHRFVRHPWYTMGIIIIWCRELDPVMLTSAVMLTLYFILGSRLEERKLLQYHGEIYRQYMQKVPGLLPRPWRYLSRSQARELLSGRLV